MTPQELAAELRTRINPQYAAQLGTESYERRLCAEAIEGLIAERDEYQRAADTMAMEHKVERDALKIPKPLTNEQIDALWHNTINTVGICHRTHARAIEQAHGIKGQP